MKTCMESQIPIIWNYDVNVWIASWPNDMQVRHDMHEPKMAGAYNLPQLSNEIKKVSLIVSTCIHIVKRNLQSSLHQKQFVFLGQ